MFQGFDDDEITYTTPNSQWEVLHTFEGGQEIEIDVVIVYYHWVSWDGRREVHASPPSSSSKHFKVRRRHLAFF